MTGPFVLGAADLGDLGCRSFRRISSLSKQALIVAITALLLAGGMRFLASCFVRRAILGAIGGQ